MPIDVALRGYDYGNDAKRDLITCKTDDGSLAHRVYQVPRSEEDLRLCREMMPHMSIVAG